MGEDGEFKVVEEARTAVRNSLLGLGLLQLAIGSRVFLERTGTAGSSVGGLSLVLLVLAVPSAAFAAYVAGKAALSPVRKGIKPLIVGVLVVSGLSLSVVDYGALGGVGPIGIVVFVVSTLVAYRKAASP